MASIAEIRGLIKSLPPARRRDIITIVLIALVSLGSFLIGRLSVLQNREVNFTSQSASVQNAIAINNSNSGVKQTATKEQKEQIDNGSVVASKAGTKYHFPWCAGAQSIKEENKISFDSIEAARAAGYTPAANCKGLK